MDTKSKKVVFRTPNRHPNHHLWKFAKRFCEDASSSDIESDWRVVDINDRVRQRLVQLQHPSLSHSNYYNYSTRPSSSDDYEYTIGTLFSSLLNTGKPPQPKNQLEDEQYTGYHYGVYPSNIYHQTINHLIQHNIQPHLVWRQFA